MSDELAKTVSLSTWEYIDSELTVREPSWDSPRPCACVFHLCSLVCL